VTATLEHQKQNGAVAVNSKPRIYARWISMNRRKWKPNVYMSLSKKVGAPSVKNTGFAGLSVSLHRTRSRASGNAVHIHVLDNSAVIIAPATVMSSARVCSQRSSTQKNYFVILHGGIIDQNHGRIFRKGKRLCRFSNQGLTLYPRALSEELRNWLE